MIVQADKAVVGLSVFPVSMSILVGRAERLRKCEQRTFIGNSDLEGWGLFIGEEANLPKLYIGDYRGEVINEHEANYRRYSTSHL